MRDLVLVTQLLKDCQFAPAQGVAPTCEIVLISQDIVSSVMPKAAELDL